MEAGGRLVDPAAESRGEQEDADGFGDTTSEVSLEIAEMALLGGNRYLIDEAKRFPGKATWMKRI